jgi:uncharacterized protein YndB with AHSA1/START domain
LTPDGTSRRYRAQPAALAGLCGALSGSTKWSNVEDAPERSLAEAYTKPLVAASVEVPTDQATAFRAFADPEVYTRWLGVPVRITNGAFACTLEWGTQVRGRYEVVCPPELIALRWDFEDDVVPVPGGDMTGYIRFTAVDGGTRVDVHQIVDTGVQAEFMEGAWTLVLGRFRSGVVRAFEPGVAAPAGAARPKRRRSA